MDTQKFGQLLMEMGFRDFSGVPCSYLAPLINFAINANAFIMANNEGDAVAIASGISLAGEHSAWGKQCDKILDFPQGTDAKSANLAKNPKSLHSPTANLRMLDYSGAESQVDSKTCHCEEVKRPKQSIINTIDHTCKSIKDTSFFAKTQYDKSEDSINAKKPTHNSTFGVVLMQNSGLSNALSPLTSLNDTFGIPILGFVSLRGERDSNGNNTDEPQHELLGVITDKLLATCDIPYAFLSDDLSEAKAQLEAARQILKSRKSFFFIVRNGVFSKVELERNKHSVCGDFSVSASNATLRRPSNTPHSLISHNTKNSLTTLECEDSHKSLEASISQSKDFTQDTRIADSCGLESNADSKDSESIAQSATQSRPSRGAEHWEKESSSAFSNAKLEREKRGSPLDCRKSGGFLPLQDYIGAKGSGVGLNPFLREKENKKNVDSESCEDSKDSLNSKNTESNDFSQEDNPLPTRLQALHILQPLAQSHDAALLATTGKSGRELYEIADSKNQLYMVGSMGCVSSLALGISLKSPKKVIALDGDSALLMRLGALAHNAYYARAANKGNFCHILLDNESHDSTGGQENLSPFVDFPALAQNCGYDFVRAARDLGEFQSFIESFLSQKSGGATFIYLKIAKGSKKDLGRPNITPKDVAKRFSAFLNA